MNQSSLGSGELWPNYGVCIPEDGVEQSVSLDFGGCSGSVERLVMRFLAVIGIKRFCHVPRGSSLGGRNLVHLRGFRDPSTYNAPLYRREVSEIPIRRGRDYGDVSSVGRHLPYGECFSSRVMQSSKLLLSTMVGSWRGNSMRTDLQNLPYWATCLRIMQARTSKIAGQRSQSIRQAPHILYTPRRHTFAIIADSKGQIFVRFFGLVLGGSFLFKDMPVPTAEQLHGKAVINSINPERLSVGALTVAYFRKTVETILLLSRALYLLALFMPAVIVAPFASHVGGRARIYWLQLLLSTLEHAGPAFIKWGQWAATRPDVFPQDICEWLSKLHMQAPAHSFKETRRTCEKAFRARLEDIFEEFSEEPVASGSIAQVHKAVLKQQYSNGIPGRVVAVKVRHPSITKVIQRDFVIIKWLAKVSTVVPGLRHLQLDKTVQQFDSFMTKQVDLTLEAAHLLRFIYNFRRSRNVFFPVPIYPLVHPGVLVETYEEGQSIANFVDHTTHLTPAHTQLAYIGSSALLKMLLKDNFIHGDLHPGNIFVRFKNRRPNVILLDVGMTAELSSRSRQILVNLFEAIAKKDGKNVAEWTLQFSDNQSCPDPEAFTRDVDLKFKEYLSVRGTPKNTGECMTELFDQVRKHKVNIDGDVCTVMVTTLILESWQRKLDPELDIITMVGDLLLRKKCQVPYEYALLAVSAP
ncbi:hypothetical protein R1flu_019950 [Riccia fluitans]|uniref:Protein kinase domain-containing protein n=1 Tax=Riccia fluitans TaxID=41844 RepID=A0ABD1ZKI9_9MARC